MLYNIKPSLTRQIIKHSSQYCGLGVMSKLENDWSNVLLRGGVFETLLRETKSCGQIHKTIAGTKTRRAIQKNLELNDRSPWRINSGCPDELSGLSGFKLV